VGGLFALAAGAPGQEAARWFGDFGNAFEDYCLELLEAMYPGNEALPSRLTPRPSGRVGGQLIEFADATVLDVEDFIIFEMKAKWLNDDPEFLLHPDRFLRHLRAKYVQAEEGNAAIQQLVRAIELIASGNWRPQFVQGLPTIAPVLVCYDVWLTAPGFNWFFADEFKTLLAPEEVLPDGTYRKSGLRVLPLVILTVEDLENLERTTEHISLAAVLRRYSNATPDRMASFKHYAAAKESNLRLYASRSVATAAEKALSDLQQRLFPGR